MKDYIPKPLQDASFRTHERIMIKTHLFLMVAPLETDATMDMFCSGVP